MIVLWYIILGSFLVGAFIMGAFGILCTQSRRDLVPSLSFGLPAILLSMLVFAFCVGMDMYLFSSFAIPPLLIGVLAVWRGLRTGNPYKDRIAAAAVCFSLILAGGVLAFYPTIPNALFLHFLPGTSIL
jgi:hypothetical protein